MGSERISPKINVRKRLSRLSRMRHPKQDRLQIGQGSKVGGTRRSSFGTHVHFRTL
jgi:hypothetical protein